MAIVDPYPTLDTLKPFADDVWVVDGPTIMFGLPLLKIPFSTRMTVLRLNGGRLLLHSPTRITEALVSQITAIGAPNWIVGPNRLHYWWIPDWKARYPAAQVFIAPGIVRRAAGKRDVKGRSLKETPLPWAGEVDTLAAGGGYLDEFAFFHRASRTLILTDLMENIETSHVHSAVLRFVMRLARAGDGEGATPRDLRLTYRRHLPELRAAVLTMLSWQPERIVLSHGRCYTANGAEKLRCAFGWLLK